MALLPIASSCLVLALGCLLLRESSALQLPSQTTTTEDPDTTDREPIVEEEIYTTKRSVRVLYDSATRFPLPVVNSELKPTPMTVAATTRGKQSVIRVTTARATIAPARGTAELPLYRLNASNGKACILLQVDALITVTYRTKLGTQQEADIYVPDDAKVFGNCDDQNYVSMSLKWDVFVLLWNFAKTPGGERWYVDKIELTYNSSDRHFEHVDQPNRTVRLSSAQKHSSMLFPTPVGKSFSCDDEQEIPLTDGKVHASVLLRRMKVQPFKFKNNEFAVEFSCTALSARANRDETAPLVVGSTLAASVLLTIAGYAGWRHFKVKKVQYDTME